MRRAGTLALVLHGHLPFVRHPEHDRFLEEDWLFEAITECYLPLLDTFERLVERGHRFRVTLSLSPTLLSMLDDTLLRARYARHLEQLRELAGLEIVRTSLIPQQQRVARMYAARLRRAQRKYADDYRSDLAGAFGRLQDFGCLELITTAATHAYLPLLQRHPRVVAAQLRVAVQVHRRLLSKSPAGIWLPECGYLPGLEDELASCGLGYFITDAHGLLYSKPSPRFGVFAPILSAHSVAAFGRELSSSRQVWSAIGGYPGHPEYRDFYRDIGFDLDLDVVRPYVQPTGARKATGIKVHRITGSTTDKQLYRPEQAGRIAQEHAAHFAAARLRQLGDLVTAMGDREPIVVAPYDAELFGHWWFEGPRFLEFTLRDLCRTGAIAVDSPGRYLQRQTSLQPARPAQSSWGKGGYHQVWLNEQTDWLYNHLDRACSEMTSLASATPAAGGLVRRALNQAARELMLAQASDWAFILKTGTTVDYALRRIRDHLSAFGSLAAGLRRASIDPALVARLEARHNLFPDLDYRVFRQDWQPAVTAGKAR
jgi:1,4-alpha-glucan branching enzyme